MTMISQLQGGGYPSDKEDGELSEEEEPTPSPRVTRSTPAVKSKIVVPPNGKTDSNTDKTKNVSTKPKSNANGKKSSTGPSLKVQLNDNGTRKIAKISAEKKKKLAQLAQEKKDWSEVEVRLRNNLMQGRKNVQVMQNEYQRFVAQRPGFTHAGRPQTRSPLTKDANVIPQGPGL